MQDKNRSHRLKYIKLVLAGINSFSQFLQHIKIKSAEPSDKSGIKSSFTVLEGYIKTDRRCFYWF